MERQRQTFILIATKDFRYFLRLYMKNSDGKTEQRPITFTTEHKVNEKERTRNARKIAAEFSTSDENIIDALYRDTGYGKTFVHKDDPKGLKKLEPFKITPVDAKKIALSNLFKAAELDFDPTKSVEVLNEEYRIHVTAKAGVNIGSSTAAEIPHKMVNVQQSMIDQANTARNAYEEKYGEEIPGEFKDDLGFLSALADPSFDAKAYIAENSTLIVEETGDENKLPDSAEELQKLYFDTFGVNVANVKKNDIGWMKSKIEEKQAG